MNHLKNNFYNNNYKVLVPYKRAATFFLELTKRILKLPFDLQIVFHKYLLLNEYHYLIYITRIHLRNKYPTLYLVHPIKIYSYEWKLMIAIKYERWARYEFKEPSLKVHDNIIQHHKEQVNVDHDDDNNHNEDQYDFQYDYDDLIFRWYNSKQKKQYSGTAKRNRILESMVADRCSKSPKKSSRTKSTKKKNPSSKYVKNSSLESEMKNPSSKSVKNSSLESEKKNPSSKSLKQQRKKKQRGRTLDRKRSREDKRDENDGSFKPELTPFDIERYIHIPFSLFFQEIFEYRCSIRCYFHYSYCADTCFNGGLYYDAICEDYDLDKRYHELMS